MNPKQSEFSQLCETYSVIPLVRRRLADFETPISIAAKLEQQGRFFLLESVEGGENWGRYSILGFHIEREFIIEDGKARLETPTGVTEFSGNPLDALQKYLAEFKLWQVPDLPRFVGGAVGFFSFEAVRFFERCGTVRPPSVGFEDARFMIVDDLVVFDNLSHTLNLVHCVHPGQFPSSAAALADGLAALDRMETFLFSSPPASAPGVAVAGGALPPLESNLSREAFEQMVSKAKGYIHDGDIIQVVLAQHFSTRITASPLAVYRALRYINPSPYMYYLKLDDRRAIVGSSPEVMVRVCDRLAEIRPIAGTRPRGATPEEDRTLAEELLADPKECAEHVMLVDLARNDLGRIAEIGSVRVRDYMIIERYSHVMHIVSQVDGKVRDSLDALDVFRATFPAGTLSGAPKVRAMEIINELEPQGRGPYGGALGYIGYGGQVMDLAITIRTLVLEDDQATVTAGAGIVYDSVPEREYSETRHKSRGMWKALALAESGLRLEDKDTP